jgi:octanoyl-[GcvH]:protein N-octanoyltransferase
LQAFAHKSLGMTDPPASLTLLRDSFPDRPAFGTAVSESILTRVAAGELGPILRLHRPGPELAFSKQDAASPGFERAVTAAVMAGFAPVRRLAGGRAAAFHEGTLALALATPEARPARTTRTRFAQVSEAIAAALRQLGIDTRVGEIPGEYCPGAWSVNARGASKLAGIGQRLVAGGAHVGGVVVVSGSDRLRAALEPVYDALGLDWVPATAGSVEDEVGPIELAEVEEALLAELGAGWELVPGRLDPTTLALAERLEEARRLDGPPPGRG